MGKFWESNKISIAIIFGAAIVGFSIYLSRMPQVNLPVSTPIVRTPAPTPVSSPAPEQPAPVPTPTVSATSTPVPTSKPSPFIDDTAAIKSALIDKTGISETNLEFQISQNTGQHAKGTVKAKDEIGGGYWIAAMVEGRWLIVYDGQSQPTCAQIAPYNFPKEMVPECLDAAGSVIER